MSTAYQSHQRSAVVEYGDCAGIWIMLMFAKPSAADMYLARTSLKAMQRAHPGGFPTLTWILPEAGFSMDRDAREAATDVTREFASVITAMATLIEGSGFQAAAVRAIVSGLDSISRASAPKKTFADLSPSIAWCSDFLRQGNSPRPPIAPIVSALVQLRADIYARIGQRAPGAGVS